MTKLNIKKIRKDFKFIQNHPNFTFLDSAATSLTPNRVVDAIEEYYYKYNTNIHSSDYFLGSETLEKFKEVRVKVGDTLVWLTVKEDK